MATEAFVAWEGCTGDPFDPDAPTHRIVVINDEATKQVVLEFRVTHVDATGRATHYWMRDYQIDANATYGDGRLGLALIVALSQPKADVNAELLNRTQETHAFLCFKSGYIGSELYDANVAAIRAAGGDA